MGTTSSPAMVSLAAMLSAAWLLGVVACGANHTDGAGPTAADTARGIVDVVGAEPATRVALRTPGEVIPLTGAAADTLRLAQGVEVWVSGSRGEDGALRIASFRVRSADGVEARDGVLELDGDAAVLVTRSGERVRYAPVPPALRRLEGRHVWISGPPGAEPRSWGSLDRSP